MCDAQAMITMPFYIRLVYQQSGELVGKKLLVIKKYRNKTEQAAL